MRKIRDNLYVFSMSRATPGQIIACRTRNGVDAERQQVFSYLGIPRMEHSFFMCAVTKGECSCIAVVGEREGCRRQMLIFDAIVDGTGLYIAFELLLPFECVSAVLYHEEFCGVSLSPETERSAYAQELTEIPEQTYAEVCGYIVNLLQSMGKVKTFATVKAPATEEQVSSVFETAAELVGVNNRFQCHEIFEQSSVLHQVAEIFDRAACAAVMLTMAIWARHFSKQRNLQLTVIRDGDRQVLSFELEASEPAELNARLQKIKDMISHGHSFACDVMQDAESVRFRICPLYADMGLAGIKRFLLQLRYEDGAEDHTFAKEEE